MQNAKQFLIDRILDQAKFEDVPLTDIEIRMLKFTEATSGSKDLEAAAIFDRDYDEDEYEKKIADLIRDAYARDKQAGDQEAWDSALVRVSGRDLYLNVMIGRSRVGTSPMGSLRDWRFFVYGAAPWALSFAAAVLVGFSPLGARLVRSDALRLVITICILGTPYVVLRPKRRQRKSRTRFE
jgi:hypothetical protein